MHRKTCGKEPANPFKEFLHTQPEQEVYKLLIDCYRMRQEDDYVFSGVSKGRQIMSLFYGNRKQSDAASTFQSEGEISYQNRPVI